MLFEPAYPPRTACHEDAFDPDSSASNVEMGRRSRLGYWRYWSYRFTDTGNGRGRFQVSLNLSKFKVLPTEEFHQSRQDDRTKRGKLILITAKVVASTMIWKNILAEFFLYQYTMRS